MRMWNMHFMNVEIRGLPVRIDSLFLLCLWWSLNSDCPVWWHVPSSIEPHCHSQNITFTWSLMHTYAKWVGGLSVVLFNTLGICGYLCWRAVDQLLHCRNYQVQWFPENLKVFPPSVMDKWLAITCTLFLSSFMLFSMTSSYFDQVFFSPYLSLSFGQFCMWNSQVIS